MEKGEEKKGEAKEERQLKKEEEENENKEDNIREEKKEEQEGRVNEDRIRQLTFSYYSRKDIQDAIFNFCKNRETIPRYFEGFGKRPDLLQFPSDIMQQVKKGATSFHCSEEIWEDPLKLALEMPKQNLDELRIGWDLLIDVDSKYLDYSKIATQVIIQALEFHGVKNIGIKFSGSKGFHIIVPWQAFPEIVNEQETKNMFPDWARMLALYIKELIQPELIERITALSQGKSYVKDFESVKEVVPDIILVSPRHLFRAPYSLHEKTSLASIVIAKEEIAKFKPQDADPLKVKIKNYYPEARKNEARELLLQALDWFKAKKQEKREGEERKYEEVSIDKSSLIMPPCINKIMQGLKDGKKRALFILINYFRSLSFTEKEIENKINEWNKKNEKPLREGYISSQLSWAFRNKKILPPNCDKTYYKDISVCEPDALCEKIKNPVNYTIRKQRRK